MSTGSTCKKYTDTIPNEDALRVGDGFIAVSDGAGGCGLFCGEWSNYLLKHLSEEKPITSFDDLDSLIERIWEPFYKDHERIVLEQDGLSQNKFYKEGSCATLAAAWLCPDSICKWAAYGDSAVFHYNKSTDCLEYSFTHLEDFSNPPYLISCKDPLVKEGFKSGEWSIDDNSRVFIASDALAHYILLMFMATHPEWDKESRQRIIEANSQDLAMLQLAESMNESFPELVEELLAYTEDEGGAFRSFLVSQHQLGLLDIDDYTLAFL